VSRDLGIGLGLGLGAGAGGSSPLPSPIAIVDFQNERYIDAAGVSRNYADILDPYHNVAGVVAGEGLRITATQASASDSVFSTPEFFAPITPTHSGVFDVNVQFSGDGELAIVVFASNFSETDGRAVGPGAELWSGAPGTFDGFYMEDKNNIDAEVRALVRAPLTVGDHRISYSISPSLCMTSVDAGPVVSYVPAPHTDFSIFDRFNFYIWRRNLSATPTLRRVLIYEHIADPQILQALCS
jgi:hypothetical protein